jgi:hypothetical protein
MPGNFSPEKNLKKKNHPTQQSSLRSNIVMIIVMFLIPKSWTLVLKNDIP